ncbi:hypothetical protein [Paenibacillus illinoisensis]|uniref:hypothetical protein n=1 Tax=Paenibacillus illinoisensis TaxID=59845 RepID=UPI00301C2BBD
MFEIIDIRQKPDMLQAAIQHFWKQWGTETSYHFYQDYMKSYYEKNDWTYIGKGYLVDDEETRFYELQI